MSQQGDVLREALDAHPTFNTPELAHSVQGSMRTLCAEHGSEALSRAVDASIGITGHMHELYADIHPKDTAGLVEKIQAASIAVQDPTFWENAGKSIPDHFKPGTNSLDKDFGALTLKLGVSHEDLNAAYIRSFRQGETGVAETIPTLLKGATAQKVIAGIEQSAARI
jgi:hypothetical protein